MKGEARILPEGSSAERSEQGPPARRRFPWMGVAAFSVLVICGTLAWLILAASAPSAQDRAAQAGLAYARTQMAWTSGPTLQTSHVTTLRSLRSVLIRTVPTGVQQDVNTRELIRQYGVNRRVALVIVNGVFNSLPPDEGVIVHGDAVVIVDMKTDQALLLMD